MLTKYQRVTEIQTERQICCSCYRAIEPLPDSHGYVIMSLSCLRKTETNNTYAVKTL